MSPVPDRRRRFPAPLHVAGEKSLCHPKRLAQYLGGAGVKPDSAFMTSLGPRYVDRFVEGIAYESKAGLNVGLTSSLETQIGKDVELITSGQIRGAEWHFWRGAQPETLDALQQAGIGYVVH